MTPVFTYRWQLWLFTVSLVFFMALPFVPKPGWMDRSILYRMAVSDNYETNYAFNVMQGKGDIDILFVGPSITGSSVNPLLLQAALKRELGYEPVINVIYHSKSGFDYDYIAFRDLIQRRHVKLVLWDSIRLTPDYTIPYKFSNYLWDWSLHGELIDGLKVDKLDTYVFSMMTGLKLVMSPVLDKGLGQLPDKMCDRAAFLGACMRKPVKAPPALPANIQGIAAEKLVHYHTSSAFTHENHVYTPALRAAIDAFVDAAEQGGSKIALYTIPDKEDPADSAFLPMNEAAKDIPMLYASRKTVFPTLRMEDMLFNDERHLNRVGTNYMTRRFFPGVRALYYDAIGKTAPVDGAGEDGAGLER